MGTVNVLIAPSDGGRLCLGFEDYVGDNGDCVGLSALGFRV